SPGLIRYEVRLEVEGDPLKENNIGRGVVRVEGGPELLVLNADGKEDNLVRALRAGRVTTSVAAASQHPLTQESLVRYRAVILENVPASDLGRLKMERLVQFVEDLGGGLMLTGGERSFGTGGYFKSPFDDVLPVSMEMREEHRKTRVAIAIALDRSGSMAISVKGGKTKMDLANLGTAECIKLLSPGDSVAVIAVDSSPHVVQPLTPVDDPARILPKVLKIESMGGGIFVYEALVAAGDQLMRAEQSTRHIILFSDAADSEEPGNFRSLLAKYEAVGITTSVIGLGSKTDVDAKLLEDVAALGKGNIMFTADPEELPRLFTQDTMSIARNSFIKKEGDEQATGIPAKMLADIRLMGEFSVGAFPRADGYNLSYLKPDATLGVVSQDEYTAPWSAFWYRGLGRVAALTIEVDGQYTGQFGRWDEYADFLVTQARWLLGGDAPDAAYLTVTREGQDAVVTLELDPERGGAQQVQAPSLVVARASEEPDVSDEIPFEWQGANVLQTRFKLDQTGTYLPVVKLGGRKLLRGPAITLPYSPEYAPRSGLPTGAETLKALAELTGGKPRVNPREVLADPPRSNSWRSLAPLLLVLAVALLLLEIAGRRLSLWEKLTDAIVPAVPPTRPASRARRQPVPAAASARTGKPRPVAAEAPSSPKTEAPAAPAAPAAPTAADVFEQAKRRARKRL
ncbi:MAG TPA: vWA domain-containing protein, partial [Planctomycetaceae bacterium]|nr:vWA domain-containing protein [Planctomycetaceae bacterium]